MWDILWRLCWQSRGDSQTASARQRWQPGVSVGRRIKWKHIKKQTRKIPQHIMQVNTMHNVNRAVTLHHGMHAGVSFENTPFEVGQEESRHCRFGPHYFKNRERTSSWIFLQGTRKLRPVVTYTLKCMHEYKLNPEYAIKEDYKKHSELKRLQQNKLKPSLQKALSEWKPLKVISWIFLSLSTNTWISQLPSNCHSFWTCTKGASPISCKIKELV